MERNKKIINHNSSIPYKSKMISTWDCTSKKIIKHCKKSKVKEIKEFYKNNKNLLDTGCTLE